jgi:hypothetical protein
MIPDRQEIGGGKRGRGCLAERTAVIVTLLLALAVSDACSYGAQLSDCTVRCTDATGCPTGFSCSTAEGLCRRTGSTTFCPPAGTDAPGPDAFDPSACPATYTISLPSTTSRYRIASDGLEWTQANAACVADQASPKGFTHLVVFADRQEQTELEAIVDDVWVGYSDGVVEGMFLATTSEPIGDRVAPGSTAWASGEPNHQTATEDCVEIILEGGLNDNDCTNTRMFVCECDAYANDPSRY